MAKLPPTLTIVLTTVLTVAVLASLSFVSFHLGFRSHGTQGRPGSLASDIGATGTTAKPDSLVSDVLAGDVPSGVDAPMVQSASPRPLDAQDQWEYAVFMERDDGESVVFLSSDGAERGNGWNTDDGDSYRELYAALDGREEARVGGPVDILNTIGSKGWELVSIVRMDDGEPKGSLYWFKRPK